MLTRRTARLPAGWTEREFAIAKGTSLSGGRREDLLTSAALPTRLESLAAELDNQIRIEFARPGSLLAPKKVEVKLVRPGGLEVRASRLAARSTRNRSEE